MTTTPLSLPPWKRRPCRFYLKVLCCILFLLIYFAIFLHESINATKLKQNAMRQQQLKRSSTAGASSVPSAANGKAVQIYSNNVGVAPRTPVAGARKTEGTATDGNNKTVVAVNSLYEYSDELNAALEQEFAGRNQLLAEECANMQLTNRYPPNAWEFFLSPGHSLAWCPVFKAASSLWLYYFNVLGGYNVDFLQRTKMPPLELARKKFPRPSQEELADALATSTSFLIVREPFERLVSAYRNKFEGSRNKYYKQLGDRIVKMFRSKGQNGTATAAVVAKKNHKGPTFDEFARYVVARVKAAGVGKINEHWTPIYSFCTPCTINFTLIVKTETLTRDSEYILRQALLESLLFDKLPKKSKLRVISNRSMVDTKSVKLRYFSELSVNILEELLKIYGPDFQLFGYNSTVYYEVLERSRQRAVGDK